MDPIFNKNQNNPNNILLNSQIELNEENNTDKNLNPHIKIINLKRKGENSSFSSKFKNYQNFINKKRKNPSEEKNEEHENILNKFEMPGIPSNYNLFIKKEIEEKKNKKVKLEEEIQVMEIQLTSLNNEIENYKKILNFLQTFNSLFKNTSINEEEEEKEEEDQEYEKEEEEGEEKEEEDQEYEKEEEEGEEEEEEEEEEKEKEDKINIMDKYNYNSKEDSYSFNQNINHFEALDNKTITLKKENQNLYNKYLTENDEYSNFSELSYNYRTKILKETINDGIKENKNYKNSGFIFEGIDQYSFRCLSNDLNYKIKEGTQSLIVEIILENNGKLIWPENETFLITDESESSFTIQEIRLNPLEPGKKDFIYIDFNLNKCTPGLYKISFLFFVKDKYYGNNIIINIEVY